MTMLRVGRSSGHAGFTTGFPSKAIHGTAAAGAICLHVAPAEPHATTSLPITFPLGKWTVAGIVFDPNAPTTGPRDVSLTHSVTGVVVFALLRAYV